MSSSWKTILRDYASNPDPTTIPRTRYLNHNDKFLTIIDCYPKAMYHLLVLPRVRPGWTAEQLLDLRTVMKNQERAKELMTDLKKYADEMEKVMENEMEGRWNFKWDINKGFHPNPSIDHLHLHIISNDLCGEWLKKKKHYNSFNPKRGFWVPLRKVLNWCKINVPFSYEKETNWLPSQYDQYLTQKMFCHQCGENGIQTMPGIIAHLKMHWDKTVEDETAKYERRVKFEAYVARKRARAEAQAQQAGTSKDAEKASTSKDGEEVGTSKDAKEADTSESAVAAETSGASGNTDDSDDAESGPPKAKRQRTEEKSDGDAALFEAVD